MKMVNIQVPMYYLERGLGKKWLAVLFAIFGTTASFGIGNMVQSNSVAEAMRINFFPPALTGIVMSFLIAIVILGGVKNWESDGICRSY